MAHFVRTLSQFTTSEIASLKKNARVVSRDSAFTMLVSERLSSRGRILIVLPRKTGTAPQRNKLRRQLKSIFYEHKLFLGDHDWIVIVRPPAALLTFSEIQDRLLSAVKAASRPS